MLKCVIMFAHEKNGRSIPQAAVYLSFRVSRADRRKVAQSRHGRHAIKTRCR